MRLAWLRTSIFLAACSSGGDGETGSSSLATSTGTPATTTTTTTTDAADSTGDPTPTTTTQSTTDATTTTTTPDPSTSSTAPGSTSSGEPGTGEDSSTGAPLDPNVNVDPSMGMGGAIAPGSTGLTPLGAEIYVPTTYDPRKLASPVIWLFNETLDQWQPASEPDAAILVDLREYNDTQKIVAKINETVDILEAEYNVDRGRYYWAGWSAGGNLVIIIGSQNQDTLAGTMVFPGTGGNAAQPALAGWNGHKIRMYYACGSEDPNFDPDAVKFEADAWSSQYGYTTRFDLVPGAPHYLDEPTYTVRAAAWAWMRGYNLEN